MSVLFWVIAMASFATVAFLTYGVLSYCNNRKMVRDRFKQVSTDSNTQLKLRRRLHKHNVLLHNRRRQQVGECARHGHSLADHSADHRHQTAFAHRKGYAQEGTEANGDTGIAREHSFHRLRRNECVHESRDQCSINMKGAPSKRMLRRGDGKILQIETKPLHGSDPEYSKNGRLRGRPRSFPQTGVR